MKALLAAGADIAATCTQGMVPLHLASQGGHEGHEGAMALLLDAGADVGARCNEGMAALHLASKFGHAGAMRLLLDAGVDASTVVEGATTPADWCPFQDLGESGEWIKEMFMKPGKEETLAGFRAQRLRERGDNGRTPLHLAALHGREGAVKALIDAGADLAAKDPRGETPLHSAVQASSMQAVKLMLAAGADASAQDRCGEVILHSAVITRSAEVVQLLLAAGASGVSDKACSFGFTPLQLSAMMGSVKMARVLLDAGASEEAKDDEAPELPRSDVEVQPLERAFACRSSRASSVRLGA